jgi:malate dehydrogenase (oxaloacetate-decarboxylating)
MRPFIVRDGRIETCLDGASLLGIGLLNKGTAFTREERAALGLEGLLPPIVDTLDEQVARARRALAGCAGPLERHRWLRALQDRHEVLFHALLARHIEDLLPLVYTPTVGDAILHAGEELPSERGLTITPDDVPRLDAILARHPLDDVRMIVATDASAILGLGDQGWAGLAIPIGKLALYTVGGGVAPWQTLPVVLDAGTDRADLIGDPTYPGMHRKRLRGDAYLAFLDRFVAAVKRRWPRAVLQWEDLAKDSAFTVLDRFRRELPSFNDDIQGTGAVALAGVEAACRLRGEKLERQRIIVYGAGAGGIGVAWALREGLIAKGLSREEAARRIWVLDSRGLITSAREVEGYKRGFARDDVTQSYDLLQTIRVSGATVLLGLSGQTGAFSQEIAAAMCEHTIRPIIFPLSNPTSACEARPQDLAKWTDGRAIVAAGSPFPDVPQGNNAFIFPGLGLGAILSGVRHISDAQVLAASGALASYSISRNRVYPSVAELPEVSIKVAAAVTGLPEDTVRAAFWRPEYLPVIAALAELSAA